MNCFDEDFEPTIDLTLFGALLKRARLNLGYRRAEDFVDAMKKATGYDVSKDIVYRMESGKKEPSVNFIIALNIMMGNSLSDYSMVEMCVPKEWKDIENQPYYRKYDYDSFADDFDPIF